VIATFFGFFILIVCISIFDPPLYMVRHVIIFSIGLSAIANGIATYMLCRRSCSETRMISV
jgi:uncharacterized membrane protein YczE